MLSRFSDFWVVLLAKKGGTSTEYAMKFLLRGDIVRENGINSSIWKDLNCITGKPGHPFVVILSFYADLTEG